MQIYDLYPKNEQIIIDQMNKLFIEWKKYLNGQLINGYSVSDLVFDGFYPYYTNQKIKMLYIGRESLGISGSNYLDILYGAYKCNRVANKSINLVTNSFHNLMFYITYGIVNDFIEWNSIPCASKLTDSFATINGISFATINISKYSNEANEWKSDWNLIHHFAKTTSLANTNFYNRQIELIDPDIIIGMNMFNYYKFIGQLNLLERMENIDVYTIKIGDHEKLFLDTFHFSAPSKHGSPEFYYYPIIKAIQKYYTKKT
ncbi:MAG TPA: hypothetical protein PLK02_08320 [Paludibacteraceae bacterium]|nr:hypothetical protein [Paludibacteraceae bacterium]